MRPRIVAVLGAAVVAAAPAACSDGIRTIEVTIEHSRFLPGDLGVDPGETVRFVISNGDPINHEFILGDQAVQDRNEVGHEPHGAIPGEISVPAGETAATTYTFAGTERELLYGCHLPGHWDYGMRGTVRVG
jgi:uncharacterized cupredoxin-like copper-binding protein